MEKDNALVGTNYLMNAGENDGFFARRRFTAFRTKYSNFGYV